MNELHSNSLERASNYFAEEIPSPAEDFGRSILDRSGWRRVKCDPTRCDLKKYLHIYRRRDGQYKRKASPFYEGVVARFLKTKGFEIPRPRNIYDAELHFSALAKYSTPKLVKWNEQSFGFAWRRLTQLFRPIIGKLQPLDLSEVTVKLDKSAGYPSFSKKREVIDHELGLSKAIWKGVKKPFPCVGFHRTQENKTRLVWGYPLTMTLLEGVFAQPAYDGLIQSGITEIAFGYSSLAISANVNAFSWHEKQLCIDWSSYDATIPARLLNMAFKLIRSLFVRLDKKHRKLFDLVKSYYLTCPILMPDGYIYYGKRRGTPSGSWFTNLVNSVVQIFLIYYLCHRGGLYVEKLMVLGDDAIIGLPHFPNLRVLESEASKLGMSLNKMKQSVSSGRPHFLGHYYDRIVPDRPVKESIQRLVAPERPKGFKDFDDYLQYLLDKSRALAVDNPKFTGFCLEMWAYLSDEFKLDRGRILHSFFEFAASPKRSVGLHSRFSGYEDRSSKSLGEIQLFH